MTSTSSAFGGLFLFSSPDSNLIYLGVYSPMWVAVSVSLAILSCYAALRAAARAEQLSDVVSRLNWGLISGLTIGTGIWAMHFIGMLALSLPCRVAYDPFVTLVSAIPGILAGSVALSTGWIGAKRLSPLVRSVLIGAGIGTMHYTGMAAMRFEGLVQYAPALFGLSIIAAIALAYAALRLKFSSLRLAGFPRDALTAITLGFAVSSMHYIAMSSAYFVRGDVGALPDTTFSPNTLGIVVAVATAFVALGALTLAGVSRNRAITDQLRSSEKNIRSLLIEKETILSNALVGIAYIKQRRIISCNRRFEDIFQYAPGELVGKSTDVLYESAEIYEHIGAFAYQIAAQASGFSGEFRMRHKDGSGFWGKLSGKAVDAAHPQDGSIWIYSDISERKLAEDELRVASIAFESQEGMMITDANKVILRVNKAFSEMSGYTAEDVVGKTPQLLESDQHSEAFYQAMWKEIELSGAWKGEIWHRRKNGDIYPEWLTITAVKSQSGAVTHYIATHTDISARKAADEKIEFLAFHDALTGLPNRRLFMERLSQAVLASERSTRYGALFLIDLDNFKTLNDTLGHHSGDLLLQHVGQRLSECVRKGDTVARLGGDEFVVLLKVLSDKPEEAASQAEEVGAKMLKALSQSYELGAHEIYSTPSMGITLFNSHSSSIEELLKQADLAMYQAKSAGRNTWRFYDSRMQTIVQDRVNMEAELREALRRQRFVLLYQPQIMGNAGHVTGAEVLVRWQDEVRGLVSPADFIPLAEETGLILPLGLWVLETACAQLAFWAEDPTRSHLTLAVNISAKQLHQGDFVEQVLDVLARSGANPKRLKLELTESQLVSNVDDTIHKMNQLKLKGVGFSLDDFGTGYSSLAYLKKLPLDQIKIDQGFVRDILSDANDAAIAKMVIALAESMGLPVIAEGVETQAQRNLLSELGCNAYQGYLFSRPLPIADFEAFTGVVALPRG